MNVVGVFAGIAAVGGEIEETVVFVNVDDAADAPRTGGYLAGRTFGGRGGGTDACSLLG